MSSNARLSWQPRPLSAMTRQAVFALTAVFGVALALRLIFYTGFFGSDEVTYIDAAARIAAGDWRAAEYTGAARYGMNLPVAFFVYVFGLSAFTANLWPLLCSLGEIALVVVMARWLWGTRAAVLGAGLLALLPIHVHFAGRMMADPPLAFFLTLSVALLLRATATRSGWTSLAAGMAWGGVFWVKASVSLLYAPVFLVLLFYLAGFHHLRRWLGVGAGMLVAVAANCLLMYLVADNPLHVFAVTKNAVAHLSGVTTLAESPWFYFRYLFMDIRHTFLLGFLALAGIIFFIRHPANMSNDRRGAKFVIVWMLLLLGMFSLAVVSFSPIKLVMKQTNYMLIFVAPMALLGGWLMAALQKRVLLPLLALLVGGSVVLSALEQQAVAVFTANSRAAYGYLTDHPNAFLLGSTNNARAVYFYSLIDRRPAVADRIALLNVLSDPEPGLQRAALSVKSKDTDLIALIDMQNIGWGNRPAGIKRVADVPSCWVPLGLLAPAPLGSGQWVVQRLIAVGALLPASLQQRYWSVLQPVAAPAPGHLFKINLACAPGS